jgi:hypothetical protein
MGVISNYFVAEFLKSLPDGWDTSDHSTNRAIGQAIGAAVEKTVGLFLDTPNHHHYQIPSGYELAMIGDVVRIIPSEPATAKTSKSKELEKTSLRFD